jgi:predicted nucleic acid-binding protein
LIFVDTSFWSALQNRRDDRHATATARLRAAADQDLITTNLVRGETWTFLRARATHQDAVHFLDQLERSSRTSVVFVQEELEREALGWLRRHDERPYSFVDATSFAVMRDTHVRQVLGFDDDFVAAGFTLFGS